MAQFSTGLGLAVLGGTTLLISLATHSVGETTDSRQTADLPKANSLTSACENLSWFDLTPHKINLTCGASFPFLPISPADVNGDGIIEQFAIAPNVRGSIVVTSGNPCSTQRYPTAAAGVPIATPVSTSQLSVSSDEVTVGTASIIDLPASFGDSLISYLPSPGYPIDCCIAYQMKLTDLGWFDCDGDGDLDLILLVSTEYKYSWNGGADWFCDWQGVTGANGKQAFWLKNIGHQRTPNAADLDGNGSVDGGDIALLLLNWTS